MKNIYVVVEGGCISYVSTDADNPQLTVHVADLDDLNDAMHNGDASEAGRMRSIHSKAARLLRIW